MKPSRSFLIFATSVCLLGTAAIAADTTTSSTPPPRKHNGPPPTPEMQAYHAEVLAIYDADRSGALDETERSVLQDDIDAGKMSPPPRPPGGHGRPMGPPPEIVAQYDTDKDGTLSDTERAALRADIESGKLKLPRPVRHLSPSSGDIAAPATGTGATPQS